MQKKFILFLFLCLQIFLIFMFFIFRIIVWTNLLWYYGRCLYLNCSVSPVPLGRGYQKAPYSVRIEGAGVAVSDRGPFTGY